MSNFDFEPKDLKNDLVTLEVFAENHRDALRDICQEEKIWRFFPFDAIGEKFNPWFDKTLKRLADKNEMPYVVRRQSDQKIVGTTRYYEMFLDHARLAIGHTFYSSDVWGTEINPASKYLLLQNAFENLKVNRVEFFTDERNAHSRAAIKKLGAIEEGLLRQHMVLTNGFVRNSFIFSIIKSDWPVIKINLEKRLKIK